MTRIEKMKSLKILNNLKTELEVSCDNLETLFTFSTPDVSDSLSQIKTYLDFNKSALATEMLSKYSGRKVLLAPLKPRINYDNISIIFINGKQQEVTYTINEIINNDIKLKKYEDVVFTYINNDMYIFECFIIEELANFFTNDELYRLQRMLNALTADYSPIENTDVYETYSESISTSESELYSQSGTHQQSETANDQSTNSRRNNVANSASDTNQVTAFNANALTDASKVINSLSTSESEYNSLSGNSTHSETANDNSRNERNANNLERTDHVLRRHGNIGVTTNQQMIESELNLRGQSFYDIIINVIADKILLKLY